LPSTAPPRKNIIGRLMINPSEVQLHRRSDLAGSFSSQPPDDAGGGSDREPPSFQPAANGCLTLRFFETTSDARGSPATARLIDSFVAR